MTADSRFILSGGEDGKVKVWSSSSGQCYVTFTEHTGPITGIAASAAMTTFFTSSLDGTARAYDLVRYRQFRVFTPPEETQLSCVAVDGSGELLAVGSSSLNRIYLFAVQTGRVVDTLQGHEGPIACLAFHPSGTTLTSGSLDHNIIFWDLFNQDEGGERLKGEGEVLHIHTEVLCVAYSSSGRRMAVLTSSGEISVYDTAVPTEPELLKTFQTNYDAAGGWQKETGPSSANYNAHFTTIAFSPEGERLVAGGESKWLVMYHALQGYVVCKWPVTTNLDVLGAEEQYQWRQISEGGFLGDIDIDDDDAQLQKRKVLELPGSRHRHHATGKRKTELTARTAHLSFAATGTEFAAATTDGLLLFSTRLRAAALSAATAAADGGGHGQQRRGAAARRQHVLALVGALTLGDALLGVECLRCMPADSIPVAVAAVPAAAFPLFVRWVSEEAERCRGWQHALLWAQCLLVHAEDSVGLQSIASGNVGGGAAAAQLIPCLKQLQRSLLQHRMLVQLARENYFSLQYVLQVARMRKEQIQPALEIDVAQDGE
ncbi:periodic tryptophan protein 2 [Strigomonas culicis]|uniref:Periodic tryptophan protein 2 n=1 Tax=Strigomonas culicis TaxID=28005 RepID=S9TKE6_9TRYP|nr:periodic tryptophan protein 2 [Strigomonas culicis]|eukprot:EPY18632.1 periodic tryptophan protein 2 [Strigomonas culicis]